MKILRGKAKVRFVAMTLAFATVVSVAVKENMFKSKAEEAYDEVTANVQEVLLEEEDELVDGYEIVNQITKEDVEKEIREDEMPEVGEFIDSYEENGVKYNVSAFEENGKRHIQVIDSEKESRMDCILSNDYNYMNIIRYKKIYSNGANEDTYKIIARENIELGKIADSIEKNILSNANAAGYRYSWQKKVKDKMKGDLWYQSGVSSYGNEYLKIGRKATYRIPVYKLSGQKSTNVSSYISNINSVNDKVNAAIAIAGTAWVSNIIAIILSAGVGAIIGVIGQYGTAAGFLISANSCYKEAARLYNIIKYYGEKI